MRPIHLLPLALLLAGCPKGDDDVTDDTDDTDVDTDSDTDVTGETGETCSEAYATYSECSATVPTTGVVISGTITTTDGSGLGRCAVRVQACLDKTDGSGEAGACLTPDCIAADGGYGFGDLPNDGNIRFEPVPLGESGLATPFTPLSFDGDETVSIDVTVPPLDPEVTLPAVAAESQVGSGLYLTVADDSFAAASPLDPVPEAIAGVNATSWMLPVEGVSGTVLAMWYLAPFDTPTAAAEGVTIRFDNTWSAADGELAAYVGDYETASWIPLGDLTTVEGKLQAANGLTHLSTVIVVRKPTM